MGGRSTSTKRLWVLLLTLLCVAARFQGIVCPGGGYGGVGAGEGVGAGVGAGEGVGAGVGAGEGVGAGAGAVEGGEAAGAGRSGSGEEGGGSTYTYGWPSSIISTGAAAAPGGVDPNTAAGLLGPGFSWVSGAAAVAAVIAMIHLLYARANT